MGLQNSPAWAERFWSKVDPSGECWAWKPGVCKRGHVFNEENTRVYRGFRVCRECKRVRRKAGEA